MKPVRTFIEELFQPVRLFFLENLSPCTFITDCTFIRDLRVMFYWSIWSCKCLQNIKNEIKWLYISWARKTVMDRFESIETSSYFAPFLVQSNFPFMTFDGLGKVEPLHCKLLYFMYCKLNVQTLTISYIYLTPWICSEAIFAVILQYLRWFFVRNWIST